MSAKSKLIKIVVPLLIIALGVIVARTLIAHRPEARKAPRENLGALVETVTVVLSERRIDVHATGTVQPRQLVEITPQVGGRVIEISPNFVAGGFFKKGETLFRIEEADFRLAVDKARASLARAEYDLVASEGQARVARQEWDNLDLAGGKEAPNPLVLHEPQLKNARAALLSAKAALREAELALERTVVRAPFDGVVRSESVDLGQIVRAGTPSAILVGTAEGEIVVPLPVQELGWLRIPRPGAAGPGSPATVQLKSGGRTFEWSGRIDRSLAEVDPQGRMARVAVSVSDPYALRSPGGERPELAVGTFVQVILHGDTLKDVAVLPAGALRDGEEVWIMNGEHLTIRPVEVLRRDREEVVIGGGVNPGERVVLTNLAGAAEGMKLRSAGGGRAAEPIPAVKEN